MVINEHYIPRLSSHYSCVAFNHEYYTVCIDIVDTPIKLNINSLTKKLLDQIDGNRTIGQITGEFNGINGLKLTTNDIINIFNKQLIGYGILEGDNVEKIKIKDKYIYLRFTIIPSVLVRRITPLLAFLFEKTTFAALFAINFLFLLYTFLNNFDVVEFYKVTSPWLTAVYFFVVFGSLILHELGHAAACDKFGAKSGPIGFGFYILSPVFYADMTDAWRLKRHERVIVDLGGIYIQLLICSILAIGFYFTGIKIYLYTSFAIAITFIVNINPFLRFDGYWALSDLLNISNLKDKSVRAIELFFGKIVGKNKNKFEPNALNIFLTSYGIVRFIAVFLFLGYMVIFRNNSVLYFPVNLYDFFVVLFTQIDNVTFAFIKESAAKLIVPFIFYFMLSRWLFGYISKNLKLKSSKANV